MNKEAPYHNKRIDRMEHVLNTIAETQKQQSELQAKQAADIEFIKKAIGGDDSIGLIGVVRTQEILKSQIEDQKEELRLSKEEFKRFKHKVYGVVTGIAATAGVAGNKLMSWLTL